MSERTKITGLSTIDFPSTMDGAVMTTTDVSKYVNTLFSKIFADYKGCIVTIDQSADPTNPQSQLNQAHPVQLQLYFSVSPADKDDKRLRAFDILSQSSKEDKKTPGRMNFVARTRMYQMAMTENKVSCITQDAVDLLYDLLWFELKRNIPENCTPKTFNDRGISLETCTSSTSQNNMFGTDQNDSKIVYGVVRFIDINEIFHLIFGDTEDSRCYYQVTPVKPVIPVLPGMTPNMMSEQKWVLYVNRLNEKGVRDVLTELGTSAPTMGPNISTALM